METIQKYRCETCGAQAEFKGAAPAVSDCWQAADSATLPLIVSQSKGDLAHRKSTILALAKC